MKEEFDVNLTPQDMYRFNMYHTYHGFHGILSIVMAILVIIVTIVTWGDLDATHSAIYLVLAALFVGYIPLSLWFHAKMLLQRSEALRNTQHFTVDEKGVTISQDGEEALLEWKQVYKVVDTKSNLLVYSTRVNAYVFPKRELGEHYEGVCNIMKQQLESYRLKIK